MNLLPLSHQLSQLLDYSEIKIGYFDSDVMHIYQYNMKCQQKLDFVLWLAGKLFRIVHVCNENNYNLVGKILAIERMEWIKETF